MKIRAQNFLPLAFLALASCASQTGWEPTIDTANDPHANRLQADLAQCQQLADKAANQNTTVAQDTAIGAVGGAASGALLGAIAGGPATGAAIGAVAGTGLGLGGSTIASNATYKNAYIHCMEKRGHPVID